MMAFSISSPSGFTRPPWFPLRRKEMKSRVAAKPNPITMGFFAV